MSDVFYNYRTFLPRLTPYALAIMDGYTDHRVVYLNVPTNLTNTVREEQTVITDAFKNDVLIIGAHIEIGSVSNGDFGQQVLLNVQDMTTGLMWSIPSPLDASPAVSYGGSQLNPMPFLKLPEAFFLKANTRLRHQWKVLGLATGGQLTWIGIQLFNPKTGQPPEHVSVNGESVRVGSRVPWFCTIGLGNEISILGSPSFVLGNGNQYVQFTPAVDCDVEIHDLNANWFTQLGTTTNPDNVRISLADKGEPAFWQFSRSPAPSLIGDFNSAYPCQPLIKPYLQKAGHRLQIRSINQTGAAVNNALLTIRGVQLCQF
jgi:hypothetical protein